MKDITCRVCGTGKRVQDSNVGKYCSRTCRSKDAERVEFICPGCQAAFAVLKSQIRGTKYCSRECELKHKKDKRTRLCAGCEKPFEGWKPSRRYCSRECVESYCPAPRFKDGRSKHPQYNRWYNMVARCTNPNHPEYPNYGARGIAVCEEWQDPFAFYSHLDTLGPCPAGHSMDRVDNDGDYAPGNIRWASLSEQNANRRTYTRRYRR